jgi:hypothetical protein
LVGCGREHAQPTGKPMDSRKDYENWRGLLASAGVRQGKTC